MALRADLVGTRVVVRRLVPGERGPSGGPALTDVLGVLVRWSGDELAVQRENGEVVVIRQAEVVTAKPVPPRAPVAGPVGAGELERVCARGWRAPVEESLGEWSLRAGGGFTGRANSALVVGDPGMPVGDALTAVAAFYAAHGLPPLAQAVVGSPELAALEQHGWVPARPHEGDAIVQVASVARALRTGPRPADDVDVLLSPGLTDDWMRRYGRTDGLDATVVRSILASGNEPVFARVGSPADAIGRAVVTGDWVGISAVEVTDALRRTGVGRAVVWHLLDWAGSRGARLAYLQTLPANRAALALYARFGFTDHHEYRYLRPG